MNGVGISTRVATEIARQVAEEALDAIDTSAIKDAIRRSTWAHILDSEDELTLGRIWAYVDIIAEEVRQL